MTQSIFNGVRPKLGQTFKKSGEMWIVSAIDVGIVVGRSPTAPRPFVDEHDHVDTEAVSNYMVVVREKF